MRLKAFTKTQVVDLNRDGEKELIIFQKIFSEHPDEQNQWNILIFEKYRERVVIIFDEKRINEYQILKTKTNSFSDIALIHNDKESENSFVQVFKSNGKIYNILTCYEEIRRYQDRKGIWHKLKKSRIEYPGDCC
ncbi:MAG: hypothetical protein HC846_02035 [Blastocatellia bacterium]|nr:hypothetical protein [Blastocatellia bacterium]